MSELDKDPEHLRPYLFHGVDLEWGNGDEHAVGTCPWCGREGKFSVQIETGLWRCFVCNEGTDKVEAIRGGNAAVFLRLLQARSLTATSIEDYREFTRERGLLFSSTLVEWGICRSIINHDWLVPGYSVERKLTNLYRYISMHGKRRLLPTPTMGHQIFGMENWRDDAFILDVCEGPWDGMALWETLGVSKWGETGLIQTSNRDISLLKQHNVIAVPGCETFLESWIRLVQDRIVNLWYDNDHERTHPVTNQPVYPAGLGAVKRIAKILSECLNPPREIHFCKWGDQDGGWNPNYPSGYDVKDYLNA